MLIAPAFGNFDKKFTHTLTVLVDIFKSSVTKVGLDHAQGVIIVDLNGERKTSIKNNDK